MVTVLKGCGSGHHLCCRLDPVAGLGCVCHKKGAISLTMSSLNNTLVQLALISLSVKTGCRSSKLSHLTTRKWGEVQMHTGHNKLANTLDITQISILSINKLTYK